MKVLKYTFLFLILMLTNSCNQKETHVLDRINFNENWFFTITGNSKLLDKNYLETSDFSNWDAVILPHTPKLEPKIVNNQWQGISWYSKKFTLSDAMQHKKLFLKFEAAMNIAEVWINNKKLIKHQGGYLPFVIDFTEIALFDTENTVHVKLNNKDNPITGPKPLKSLDFNTYGGIYRNVWLIAKNPLHITDPIFTNQVASGGVFVSYPKVSKEEAIIKVQTHIKNENSSKQSFLIKNTLLKNENKIISTKSEMYQLGKNQDHQFTSNLLLKNPELWSPDSPNLYHLKTEISLNGKIIDREITRIGIKTIKFIGQDFYLNHKKTFLRGVNRHQEYPYVGYALSDNANFRDAKKIKEAGFDYVRLSHYPQSPSFMEACDEVGLITIDAILGWQYFSKDKKFQKHVFQTAKDLIRRDRNYASVIAWEVSLNESWMPEHFIDSLTNIAKKEYPGDQSYTAGWQSYGYDIYLQARQHKLQHYDAKLKKPYNVSEYGDWEYYAMNAGLQQDSWSNLLKSERSSRQLRNAGEKALLQQATNLQEAHNDNLNTPAFADGYWVMFDYNRGYAEDLEASGIMDVFRIPKPSYYFYKSQRDADHPKGNPMVYIANQWKKESPLEVRVFSNCDEIELFLNGISLGRQKPNQDAMSNNLKHPPFTFTIPKYISGELEAKGFMNNSTVANHVVYSPEEPSKIKIQMDLSGRTLDTLHSDLVFVYASVLDKNGTVITNVADKIQFEFIGEGELIGENPVKLEAGVATILLKTNKQTNALVISTKMIDLNLKSTVKIK